QKRDSGQISTTAMRERFQFRIERRERFEQHQFGLRKGVVQPRSAMTDTHVEHSPGREPSSLSIGEALCKATQRASNVLPFVSSPTQHVFEWSPTPVGHKQSPPL